MTGMLCRWRDSLLNIFHGGGTIQTILKSRIEQRINLADAVVQVLVLTIELITEKPSAMQAVALLETLNRAVIYYSLGNVASAGLAQGIYVEEIR